MKQLPEVVIVGRPNVGKSTLLNRVLGKREAIVEERPGVTRDRKTVEAEWQGKDFLLTDTGGWLTGGSELDKKVSRQAEEAFKEADVVLFVVDAMIGVTDEDLLALKKIRNIATPSMLIANKVDNEKHMDLIWDLYSLGFGDPHPVSSLHGIGVGDMLDKLVTLLPEEENEGEELAQEDDEKIFKVALVGRPNVGKSTLFNQLIGEERSIVHDMAGTTRDTVDTVIDTPSGPMCFLDTAGMRRRTKIKEDTEYYSVLRSLKAVDGADVALLVIDATEGVTHQDQRLAERVDAAGCPIVVILNKIDLLSTDDKLDLQHQIEYRFSFLPDIDVHRISALHGKNTNRILPSLDAALDAYRARIPTRKVNDIIRRAQQAQPAPGGARILYATQGATDPPTFTLFSNRAIGNSYLRYIERQIREGFELGPTPIRLRVRLRNG